MWMSGSWKWCLVILQIMRILKSLSSRHRPACDLVYFEKDADDLFINVLQGILRQILMGAECILGWVWINVALLPSNADYSLHNM